MDGSGKICLAIEMEVFHNGSTELRRAVTISPVTISSRRHSQEEITRVDSTHPVASLIGTNSIKRLPTVTELRRDHRDRQPPIMAPPKHRTKARVISNFWTLNIELDGFILPIEQKKTRTGIPDNEK